MMEKGNKFRVREDHKENDRVLKKGNVTSLLHINEDGTYCVHDFETSRTFTLPLDNLKRMP